MTLRLGIIGSSEGNGHPYSWSAIFNGYNATSMAHCGYPAIPEYLSKQRWPDAKIHGAKVVSIWTQDPILSSRIAKASLIEHVSSTLQELESRVDAILLARDDAENHFQFAKRFLVAGMPIYIDKPVALSVRDLDMLYDMERYSGQIFTCSALRYAHELRLNNCDREQIGALVRIDASTPKSWAKYAPHIIEPTLNIIDWSDKKIDTVLVNKTKTAMALTARWSNGIITKFSALGDVAAPIQIRVAGTKGISTLTFQDSFSAFKLALEDFVGGINAGECRSPPMFNLKVTELIERGVG